jgi:hypothetical protein
MLPRDQEHFAAATTNAITADEYDHFMQGKKNFSMEELKRSPPNTIARSRYLLKMKLISFEPMAKKTTRLGDHCAICSKLLAHGHPGIRSTGSTGHGYTVKIPKTTTLRCLRSHVT